LFKYVIAYENIGILLEGILFVIGQKFAYKLYVGLASNLIFQLLVKFLN